MDSDSKEHDDMKSPALSLFRATCFVVALPIFFVNVQAQLVPGTGMKLQQVGDDFEDEKWECNRCINLNSAAQPNSQK